MSLARLLLLADGLEHSCPEGREDAAALRSLMDAHVAMRDAMERLAGLLCGGSLGAADRRDAYEIADRALVALSKVLGQEGE